MGLLDIFKKNNKPKESEKKEARMSEKRLYDGKNTISIVISSDMGSVRHSDNSEMEIFLAKVGIGEDGEALLEDELDYVGFEVKKGLIITEDILQAVMEKYVEEKKSPEHSEKDFYLGRVTEKAGKISIGKKSATVQKAVTHRVDRIIQDRKRAISNSYQKRKAEEAIARKESEVRRKALEEKNRGVQNKINASRIKDAKLQSKDGSLRSYDGVDLQSGEIIRLRNVNKVCKDLNSTYLYSAYIDRVENDYDVSFVDDSTPVGNYICFTLPGRLEDVIASDPKMMKGVLSLLSEGKLVESRGSLSYIGGIDKTGRVMHDRLPTSSALARRVQDMQKEHAEQNNSNRYRFDEGR